MVSREDIIDLMSDFGLTTNQARVYLSIVRSGLATVSKIATLSKVRREEVYRTLPKLEKMGLIERVIGTPSQIRAIPMDDALNMLLKQERDEADRRMSELTAKKEVLLNHFKTDGMRTKTEDIAACAQFSLVSEKVAILGKVSTLLKNARSQIDLALSRPKLAEFIHTYADMLRRATRRKVGIRMVSETSKEEDQLVKLIESRISQKTPARLRYAEALPAHFLIVDNKEMMISTTTDTPLAERPALWTNCSSVIGPLKRTFETLWLHSTNVDRKNSYSEMTNIK